MKHDFFSLFRHFIKEYREGKLNYTKDAYELADAMLAEREVEREKEKT